MTFNSGINNPTIQAVLSPVQMEQKQKALFNDRKRKIIVLAGPTGVGKTALSLQIARVIGGEIVSADSMQVYRGLDIGTAKVRIEERGSIRHHLIDGKDIDETFNVVDFYHEAQQAFQEIFARDHVPIVVGGTGFYIHALIYGPPQGPPSVPEIRTGLELQMEQYGPLKLYEQLKKVDPEYAGSITSFDRHKIIRALEIIYLTGQKVSSFQKKAVPLPEFDFRCWFLYKPKEILYPLLEKRCDKMIADGFLEEVKKLEKQGLRSNISASQAIGYRQCLDFLETAQTPDDWASFVEEFKKATRRYAKRQFTWFRKEALFRWLNVHQVSPLNAIEMILQDYEQAL